jgi:hypothetical protein
MNVELLNNDWRAKKPKGGKTRRGASPYCAGYKIPNFRVLPEIFKTKNSLKNWN